MLRAVWLEEVPGWALCVLTVVTRHLAVEAPVVSTVAHASNCMFAWAPLVVFFRLVQTSADMASY